MQPIDVSPTKLETVREILGQHVPELEVRAFGSRVDWTARETSDLDLVLMTDAPMDIGKMVALKAAFTKSNLPFRVDIVDWASTSESFRNVIQREYVKLQLWVRSKQVGVPKKRREVVLSEIAELVMGQSPPGSTYNDAGDGLPFFQGVKDFNYRYPTPRVFCSAPARIAQPGEILLSVRAPIGRVNVADRECATGRGLAIIRPLVPSDARYLEFVLRHMESNWDVLESGGSVFGNATKRDLQSLPLPWPSDGTERQAIAHILGTLDDKIELNRRMNETLEAMARTLFKSWFVDFDPVRDKMEGRWRRGETLPGLPAHLYDLFPDRLVDSELGEIPEGWEVKTLGDCFDLTMGQSPPGSTYNELGEGLPFFQGNADFGSRYPKKRRHCTAPTRLARPDDTLVSVRAPVGAINMAWERCCIGRGVGALRHRSGLRSFTYYSIWTLQPVLAEYKHTGTVFGAINREQFEALMVIEPPPDLINCFETYSREWDDHIQTNTLESGALAAQRDALLPRLVSGKVRVGEELQHAV
ncbi:MAG: restriction endonuclease subunit S [Acidobacteriota bacterium]|nr:restriction endonuclease subunit S [Acidobacteriota bacterium]